MGPHAGWTQESHSVCVVCSYVRAAALSLHGMAREPHVRTCRETNASHASQTEQTSNWPKGAGNKWPAMTNSCNGKPKGQRAALGKGLILPKRRRLALRHWTSQRPCHVKKALSLTSTYLYALYVCGTCRTTSAPKQLRTSSLNTQFLA